MVDDDDISQGMDQLVFCLIQVASGDSNVVFPTAKEHSPLSYLILAIQNMLSRLRETTISREWFEVMVGSIGDAVISTDTNSIVTFMNKEAETLTGWERSEVVDQKNLSDVFQIINAQTRETVESPVERVLRENVVVSLADNTLLIRRDGAEVPIDDSIAPICDRSQCVVGAVLVFREISARQKAESERKKLENELFHARKLEAVGQLAAGIAHEINTPIHYIGDNTHFLRDSFRDVIDAVKRSQEIISSGEQGVPAEERIRKLQEVYATLDLDYLFAEIPAAIGQSLEGIVRIAEIIQAMKEFSHAGGKEKALSDLNHGLRTTITVARSKWKEVAEVELECDPELPFVPCLSGEINQVFLNLIVNAAYAIEEKMRGKGKGKITIWTSKKEQWAEIRIRDTGNGIPEEIRERIFEPFFTTKDVGKGSGQGLAISYSIVVDKHQGSLFFESTVGVGTTFVVRLPLAISTAETSS